MDNGLTVKGQPFLRMWPIPRQNVFGDPTMRLASMIRELILIFRRLPIPPPVVNLEDPSEGRRPL